MMSTQGMRMLPQFFRDGSMNVPVMIPDAFLPWPEALVYKKCGCWVGWEIGHAGSRRKAKQLSRHIICIPFFMLPREAMPNPCSLQLRRQIRALQQKKRRLSSAQKKTLHASSSPRTLLVFHFSSFQPEIVADFLLGRGQSKLQLQPPDLGAKNAIVNDVKSGFEQEMALCGPDPTAWAHVTPKDNVVACRYVAPKLIIVFGFVYGYRYCASGWKQKHQPDKSFSHVYRAFLSVGCDVSDLRVFLGIIF